MLNWIVRIQTLAPLPSFPQLQVVSSETRSDIGYRCAGRFRRHEEHCLFEYTLSGEGAFFDGRREHRIPAGYGFLCEVGDPDCAYYFPPDARGPWTFVYICFTGGPATAMVRDLLARHGSVYALPRENVALSRLIGLRRSRESWRSMGAGESSCLVAELLGALAAGKEAQQAECEAGAVVRRARELIRASLERPVNATDVARSLNVSREHLARVFAAQAGISPYQFILREKMGLACRLLKESGLRNKEIAARLGYASQAHFTRAFKRSLHMTPSRFREAGVMPVF